MAAAASGVVEAKVLDDICGLRFTRTPELADGGFGPGGAGDELSFRRLNLEAFKAEGGVENAVRPKGGRRNLNWVIANDIKADIV